MRTFKRHKTSAEIKAQCKKQNLVCDTTYYDLFGGDTITVSGGGASVVYNVTNGRFVGLTPNGLVFTHEDDQYEEMRWYRLMVEFFYSYT